ncbi:hypothetical protein BKA61DRAFT_589724 [Leptodontidium sp. MPI-SDFR-AT-0119]|nr:hypothetical protein BKA61DRAFT_589724 [Leptodontidium sp. MPI-SDFR-AT-0119]
MISFCFGNFVCALLIYLHSISLPIASNLPCSTTSSAISSEIQIRIEICLPLLSALYPSRMEGVILWPSMIFGSGLKKKSDIMMLRTGMSEERYKLRTIRWVGQVLERLWAERHSLRRCGGRLSLGPKRTRGCYQE